MPLATHPATIPVAVEIEGHHQEATADLRRVVNRDRKAQEGLQQARETVRRSLENQS